MSTTLLPKPTVLLVFFGVIAETWILKQNKSSIAHLLDLVLNLLLLQFINRHSRDIIECIQHKCIQFLGKNVVGSEVIPLVSLKKRRQTLDLTFLFKCVNSKFTCNLCSLFPIKVPRRNLRNPGLFIVANNRVNATRNGFIHRLTSLYNSITQTNPSIDIFHQSISTFKL